MRNLAYLLSLAVATCLAVGLSTGPLRRPPCERCDGRGRITCPVCQGRWHVPHTTVLPCTARGQVGCDGRGYRPCGECHGTGRIKCQRCQGTRIETVEIREKGLVVRTERRPCRACADEHGVAQGYVDCPRCVPLWVCRDSGLVFAHPVYTGTVAESDGGEWSAEAPATELRGQVICPRCHGRGEYELHTGKCPHCKGGTIVCPDCHGTGKAH